MDSPQPKSRILNNKFHSPKVSSALDCINLSDTKFTILAAAIAKADGQNLDDGPLSRSTVYRKRSVHPNFKSLDDPRLNTIPHIQELRNEVVTFLQNVLSKASDHLPRDDYKEMVALCLMLLGVQPKENYHFKLPGAYHFGQWMAKVIYCTKIYLFRSEFKLTVTEEKNLKEFCMFACLIYVKAWISSPDTIDAAVNDLILFRQMKQYSSVNKIISDMAIKKFQNHLWYLGPELIPLSLFSSKLPAMEKRLMVEKLKSMEDNWNERESK